MRVVEALGNKERCLIGMDRKYLRVCSASFCVLLEDITAATDNKIETGSSAVVLEGISSADLLLIRQIVESRRTLTKEEIEESIKKDHQLSSQYKHIEKEEEKIFYQTFSERILSQSSPGPHSSLSALQSSKKRARYVLASRVLLSAFFKMNILFGDFLSKLFSGSIVAGKEENEVDRVILLELRRGKGPLERLNALSLLIESTWEDSTEKKEKQKLSQKGNITQKGKPSAEKPPLNPMLFKMEKEELQPPRSLHPNPVLTPPEIKVKQVRKTSTHALSMRLLQRMREISRLVIKSRNKSAIREAAERVEYVFKEEARRKFSSEEGKYAADLIKRISPTRFLN